MLLDAISEFNLYTVIYQYFVMVIKINIVLNKNVIYNTYYYLIIGSLFSPFLCELLVIMKKQRCYATIIH